jgi:cyclopropane fatty-acyl-phospholipid synthase-like methyltransferase
LDFSVGFYDFLQYEQAIFGDEHPVSAYDPYFIRYGEYKFLLEQLSFSPTDTVLDLGCEANIFMLFLASRGLKIIGVDIDPLAGVSLLEKQAMVEKASNQKLAVTFQVEDATALTIEANSVDKVIAVSSIEHMFSEKGHGDYLALAGIERVLKLGGKAVVTLPMSNGNPFHESPTGDAGFGYSYRLYTPEALQERIFDHANLKIVSHHYLAHVTPDPRYGKQHFLHFWLHTLTAEDRRKWAWANAMLANFVNPIISKEDGEKDLIPVNTALICLEKI